MSSSVVAHSISATSLTSDASEELVRETLEKDSYRDINILNWQSFPERVHSQWKLLHGPDAFFLHFYTKEPWMRAVNEGDSGPVCQDSCVEWFVSHGDGNYRNFEFNPIGAYAVECGAARENRKHYESSELPGFRVWTDIPQKEAFDTIASPSPWRVWAVIPYALLGVEDPHDKKLDWRANFYKCGDKLPNVHYLTWAPIDTKEPDYHRPEYFRPIELTKN